MIRELLQNKTTKTKYNINRLKFQKAELEKLLNDKKSGRISPEEFAFKYRQIEKQWG